MYIFCFGIVYTLVLTQLGSLSQLSLVRWDLMMRAVGDDHRQQQKMLLLSEMRVAMSIETSVDVKRLGSALVRATALCVPRSP